MKCVYEFQMQYLTAVRTSLTLDPSLVISFRLVPLGTSLIKVGRLEAESNCVTQTNIHYVNLYIDNIVTLAIH